MRPVKKAVKYVKMDLKKVNKDVITDLVIEVR